MTNQVHNPNVRALPILLAEKGSGPSPNKLGPLYVYEKD